jgi:hypothetical protein
VKKTGNIGEIRCQHGRLPTLTSYFAFSFLSIYGGSFTNKFNSDKFSAILSQSIVVSRKEKEMAQIFSIVYQPEGKEYNQRQPDYLRIPLEEATLIAGYGIQGDQKAGHHPDRQLNLLSYEWLQKIGQQGYRANPGEFGEQIIIQGLALEELEPGNRLQLGEQVVVEISKPRTGCDRLQAAQPRPVKELGYVGMMARVIRGGDIRTGDPVNLVEESINRQPQAAD